MDNRHHLVIAGTGRAGTTFLVRFLAECGVPAGNLDEEGYFEEARAGFERSLLDAGDVYLVKDPWFFEYVDEIDLSSITIDAVVVPVRHLRQAAMSRVRQERAKLIEQGWPTRWSTRGGGTAGGVFSLGVQEQERILALGFVKVVEWCVENEVQLVLVQFPRLVNDADYLIDKMWPTLGKYCTREHARAVFDDLAEPEHWATDGLERSDIDIEVAEQAIKTEAAIVAAERIRRERDDLVLREAVLTDDLGSAHAELEQCRADLGSGHAELEQCRADLGSGHAELEQCRAELEQCRADVEQCRADVEQCRADVEQANVSVAAKTEELAGSAEQLVACRAELDRVAAEYELHQADNDRLNSDLQRTRVTAGHLEHLLDDASRQLDAFRRSRSVRLARWTRNVPEQLRSAVTPGSSRSAE